MKKLSMLYGGIIILISIILDQLTKMLSLYHLQGNDIEIIKNFFTLKLAYNNGAAWSSFAGHFSFLMIITIIALGFFIFLYTKVSFNNKKVYTIGLSLMIGGLFGNLIDRVFMEGHVVIDFLKFDFGTYSFPTFNVADMCLVIGVGLFLIDVIFLEGKRKDA